MAHLFSPPVQNFAIVIGSIKKWREDADYNPDVNFVQDQVIIWIGRAEQAILDFNAATPQARSMVAIATLVGQR